VETEEECVGDVEKKGLWCQKCTNEEGIKKSRRKQTGKEQHTR
jgi:hypothetical protein